MALPKQTEDFPAWYQGVVKQAEMAETSLARGTMVIRPYGYALWEGIQAALDRRIKETGHENLYFPLFFPNRLLEKEAEHVEGFSPQVAVVTHGGGEELEEPLVVRPTSEALIWEHYRGWIQSYRDLPLLYNQWANVVRWELRPRLFLRTTEFLWQEGHTAHETPEEAIAETKMILNDVYRATLEEDLAIPVLPGRKSASERFPGAAETYAVEAMMRDGKALQSATSHYFAQNFSQAYDVKFLGKDGKQEHPFSTSWGLSSRVIGGVIMVHGDDTGLRLPPKLAPVQVVIVPIYSSDEERSAVLDACAAVTKLLPALRTKVDDRQQHRPGFKFNEWELKGVPIRLEIGPKEIAADEAVVYKRATAEKSKMAMKSLEQQVPEMLEQIQREMFDQALSFMQERTIEPSSYEEMKDFLLGAGGFVRAAWCGETDCENTVKTETKATIRVLPVEPEGASGSCIVCSKPAVETAVWAQSY